MGALLAVRNLTMAYGDVVIQRDINFSIALGDLFVIMGGSGCGKSTLLRHLIGLLQPAAGSILYR
ncbi:MAG: ATP-binding cassette domain-containing protein, partial [Alphaproteobacteria bacterium]